MRKLSTPYAAAVVLLSCLLFVHCSDTGLPVQASTVETHYYLHEYINEDGQPEACEIEIQGDTAVSPGPEFEELSLTGLHQKGYLSADEQIAQTPPEYVNVVGGGVAGVGASWLYFWSDPLPPYKKHVYCGSRTTTTQAEYVKVHAWRYKIDPVTHEKDSVPGVAENMRGPASPTVTWRVEYGTGKTWIWHIHGDHYWVNHNLPLLMTDDGASCRNRGGGASRRPPSSRRG